MGSERHGRYPETVIRRFARTRAGAPTRVGLRSGVFIVRSYLPVAAVCLCIMPMSMMLAAPPPASPKPATPSSTPTAASANADAFAAQAAARHAKRTECLKTAKGKKLVGANRDAFVKECLGRS